MKHTNSTAATLLILGLLVLLLASMSLSSCNISPIPTPTPGDEEFFGDDMEPASPAYDEGAVGAAHESSLDDELNPQDPSEPSSSAEPGVAEPATQEPAGEPSAEPSAVTPVPEPSGEPSPETTGDTVEMLDDAMDAGSSDPCGDTTDTDADGTGDACDDQ